MINKSILNLYLIRWVLKCYVMLEFLFLFLSLSHIIKICCVPCSHFSSSLAICHGFCSLCAYITALVSCPSGDRVVQTSCCGNLSVEPVCRPSALQRLLVCSVYRPAVLRHNVWQHLSGPSGNHVLPAHKVWCDNVDCTNYSFMCVCTWLNTRGIFVYSVLSSLNFFNLPVSLNVVPHHTLFWVWPSWCPISPLDCSTYASSIWEGMQLFRMRTSCTGEVFSTVTYSITN